MSRRILSVLGGVLAVAVAAAVVAVVVSSRPGGAPPRVVASAAQPNIVFVLTDDLDWSLVNSRYMPHVAQLERQGATFSHYFVADSLCCSSRASIFTGNFPHDTRVLTNFGPHGGFHTFYTRGEEHHTFAVALQRAGYLTAMMGKYLNGYMPTLAHTDGSTASIPATYVPPGWNEWDVTGWGYPEYDYNLNHNGGLVYYGVGPPPAANAAHYLTDVLSTRASAFIDRAAGSRRPFFLEVATFAPHSPYTPAPRNRHDYPGRGAPRDRSFNTQNTNPPDWLGHRRRLTRAEVAAINREYRRRAQAVEAVDRLVGRVESELAARGLLRDTYIVFSSDNGYHMGQHRLLPGKETAFDTDIRVPLIIDGPGVTPGRVVPNTVQNIDLYPTFVRLAGRTPPRGIDGTSLVPLLRATPSASLTWPTLALVEHHGPTDTRDPDIENGVRGGNPASYEAIRILNQQFGNAVYVEYSRTGGREYYNLDTDPFEIHNTYNLLSLGERIKLHRMLARLERCHDSTACWTAADPQPT